MYWSQAHEETHGPLRDHYLTFYNYLKHYGWINEKKIFITINTFMIE